MGTVVAPKSIPYAPRSSVALRSKLSWTIESNRPTGWREQLLRCGGGYFHTPAGVQAVSPRGELLFAQLRHGGEVVGVALGVRTGCGLSLAPRHVYFPTTPALTNIAQCDTALKSLHDALRANGCVELDIDSFDACWEPVVGDEGVSAHVRLEYLVHLDRDTEAMLRRFSPDHQRCIQRGRAEGWRLTITGAADTSGSTLVVSSADGGASCFSAAAWRDDLLLARTKVCVAGRRAYCRHTQASQLGRESGAATWLQWRMMCQLAHCNVGVYNLGTAPAASAADHPGQDPLRARIGFAPEMVRCRRVRWPLAPGHMRAHRMIDWMLT